MKKIAFLFLTQGNHNCINAWNIFFKNISSFEYSIYCHAKNIPTQQLLLNNIINTIPTKWADISLVRATLLLYNEAFKDINNYFFILVSESCIPISSFKNIKNILFKNNKSIIHYKHQINKFNRYKKLNLYIKNKISFNKFFTQYQWMILKRDLVYLFLKNDLTNYFKFIDVPDEHYFITILILFNKHKDIINKKSTYCDWSNKNSMHPKLFNKISSRDIFIGKHFFLRKISKKFYINNFYYNLISN